MENMTHRQKQIIGLLSQNERITGAQIGQQLKVSLRTVQGEISQINKVKKIILSDNKGYRLNTLDAEFLEPVLLSENDETNKILTRLITINQPIDINEFAEDLYMSLSSLKQKLEEIRYIFEDFELELLLQHSTISIDGKELNKRRFMSYLLQKKLNPIVGNFDTFNDIFQEINTNTITNITLSTIRHYNYEPKDEHSQNVLLINIFIAIDRIDNKIQENSIQKQLHGNVHETVYSIAEDIAVQLSKTIHSISDQDNVNYIAKLISGYIKPIKKNSFEIESNHSVISEEFLTKISEIVAYVFKYYMIDIDYSTTFYNFVLHIDGLMKRATYKQFIFNKDLTKSIKENNTLIYEIAVLIAKKLEELFDLDIIEDEIALMSLHLGFMINSSKSDFINKIKTVILCDDHQFLAKNIKEKLLNYYSDLITVEGSYTYLKSIDEELDVDLIITTKHIKYTNIATVNVSPFINLDNRIILSNTINQLLKKKDRFYKQKRISSFFDDKLFFKRLDIQDKNSAIQFLATKMIEYGLADDGYIESIFNRENISSNVFYNILAIPHALEMDTNQTMFSVLINEEGIPWDNQTVKIVILAGFGKDDWKEVIPFWNNLLIEFNDYHKITKLIEAKTFTDFMHIIQN